MGQFEGDNIVHLHGVVTEVQDAIIVLEYMSKGDLQEFLINLKNTYVQNYWCIDDWLNMGYCWRYWLKIELSVQVKIQMYP